MALRHQVRLEGQVSGDVDPVVLDPEKIQRVLYNLVSNAIRHTPAGGYVRLGARASGPDQVRVTVSDSGEGIAGADLPQVFERFWRGGQARTLERDGERGAGLGLAIARGLVEAHRGKSRSGVGRAKARSSVSRCRGGRPEGGVCGGRERDWIHWRLAHRSGCARRGVEPRAGDAALCPC